MDYASLFSGMTGFIVVVLLTPWFIRYLKKIELRVKDMNKEDAPLVPISGGIPIMAGFFSGIMFFVFYHTFLSKNGHFSNNDMTLLFAALVSVLIITFVGFVDDLMIKKSKESSIGLKQWQKPLLTLVAAVPLMVVNAGYSKVWFPYFGGVNIGLVYPLIFIPLGVLVAANMVNMLAGFNGMETGMGLVYTGMLALYSFVNGRELAAVIAVIAFSCLLGFYFFNKYPARVLPGDSLTYLLGAVLAVIAIVGNIERAVIVISIPFIVEFFLKLRSKFKADSFGYFKEGKIWNRHDKIYSIPHIFTRTGKFSEKQITFFMILIQLVFAGLIWVV